jgi:hypothetical protein
VRRLALLAGLVLAGGCGGETERLPAACAQGPDEVARALAAYPGKEVRLLDGSAISACVERAFGDGELQQLGFALTPAADRLVARGDAASAGRLGFLVGAVRRGAARTNGVHAELVRKLEGTITYEDPALVRAARRGIAAGEARG